MPCLHNWNSEKEKEMLSNRDYNAYTVYGTDRAKLRECSCGSQTMSKNKTCPKCGENMSLLPDKKPSVPRDFGKKAGMVVLLLLMLSSPAAAQEKRILWIDERSNHLEQTKVLFTAFIPSGE